MGSRSFRKLDLTLTRPYLPPIPPYNLRKQAGDTSDSSPVGKVLFYPVDHRARILRCIVYQTKVLPPPHPPPPTHHALVDPLPLFNDANAPRSIIRVHCSGGRGRRQAGECLGLSRKRLLRGHGSLRRGRPLRRQALGGLPGASREPDRRRDGGKGGHHGAGEDYGIRSRGGTFVIFPFFVREKISDSCLAIVV